MTVFCAAILQMDTFNGLSPFFSKASFKQKEEMLCWKAFTTFYFEDKQPLRAFGIYPETCHSNLMA